MKELWGPRLPWELNGIAHDADAIVDEKVEDIE
jgi:hypothetical protein